MEISEDTRLEIHEMELTLAELREKYVGDSEVWDKHIRTFLDFGKNHVVAALDAGADFFIVRPDQLQKLEVAVHMYRHCLPEGHPIRTEYTGEQVERYLEVARGEVNRFKSK
ncbi:hypothetical protein CL618_01785 [archaeon]|nr:hypothetical protein [archaeon]|tara:strand:+ start:569 stop:904 length:336 start_codon:yes stop_codon:yes gene_type:complete